MERELIVAIEAAKKAGDAVKRIYDAEDFEVRQKADNKGPLTEADLEANRILVEALMGAFPEDALLSEEVVDDPSRLENRRCWIIDPVDGTREFTMHIPEFCISIGLSVDRECALGVLFNPATGELFTGLVGSEATYNGKPCTVSKHSDIAGARLLVSRSEHKKGWFDQWKDEAELRPCGSVAYKFGLVAAGLAEASFTPKPRNEWDLIGGVGCILAAGGRCTNGKGEAYRFNRPDPLHIGVCGTNGAIHGAILEMIKQ